ncbi:MAG TPA: response regulator transcription factor [Chloroflexota bacterium]|jgi:two-component system response regulator NreC|nr:response regulator transcription factor [Chloroflexota bacterium]
MSERIRILLADDHAVLRAGLRALLSAEPDMEVVGEAGDGEEAVRQAALLRPDVVVMDIAMPGGGGLQATRAIRALGLPSKVLILTMHAEEQYLLPVIEAGGSGYVLKSGADSDLIEAIRIVSRDEVFLYPSAAKMLLGKYLERVDASDAAYDGLTPREREVLRLTAEGYTGQEIAERLVLSPKTIDTYRQRVMEKLNLHHRSELVKYALRKGLLRPDAFDEPARPAS